MLLSEATVRSMFCVVTQMFLSSYWHTGKIFVKTFGCFLELQKESFTYQFTRLHCRRRWSSKVWSSDNSREDLEGLASNREEAHTRIILHTRNTIVRGYSQVNVLCCDTNVLVLLLAHRQDLCQNIWMFSGTSKRKLYIPIHKIALQEEKRMTLLAFHAITRCDTTSQFLGIGKQKAWKAFDGGSVKLLDRLGEKNHSFLCPSRRRGICVSAL